VGQAAGQCEMHVSETGAKGERNRHKDGCCILAGGAAEYLGDLLPRLWAGVAMYGGSTWPEVQFAENMRHSNFSPERRFFEDFLLLAGSPRGCKNQKLLDCRRRERGSTFFLSITAEFYTQISYSLRTSSPRLNLAERCSNSGPTLP
jgi:hypothetical protein